MTQHDRNAFAAAGPSFRPEPLDLGQLMLHAKELRAEALKGFLARAFAGLRPGRAVAHPSPAPCGCAG